MIRFTALHRPAALLKTDVHLLFSSQSVYSQICIFVKDFIFKYTD